MARRGRAPADVPTDVRGEDKKEGPSALPLIKLADGPESASLKKEA